MPDSTTERTPWLALGGICHPGPFLYRRLTRQCTAPLARSFLLHLPTLNIAIIRAFVRLREILSSHKDLAHRLDELEKRVGHQDEQIQAVFNPLSLRERARVRGLELLLALAFTTPPPAPKRRRIGFGATGDETPAARLTNRRRGR